MSLIIIIIMIIIIIIIIIYDTDSDGYNSTDIRLINNILTIL